MCVYGLRIVGFRGFGFRIENNRHQAKEGRTCDNMWSMPQEPVSTSSQDLTIAEEQPPNKFLARLGPSHVLLSSRARFWEWLQKNCMMTTCVAAQPTPLCDNASLCSPPPGEAAFPSQQKGFFECRGALEPPAQLSTTIALYEIPLPL